MAKHAALPCIGFLLPSQVPLLSHSSPRSPKAFCSGNKIIVTLAWTENRQQRYLTWQLEATYLSLMNNSPL